MHEEAGYRKWKQFALEALSCLDRETYLWKHLPSNGGYYDQDEFFMEVWETIRCVYIDIKQNEKPVKKTK